MQMFKLQCADAGWADHVYLTDCIHSDRLVWFVSLHGIHGHCPTVLAVSASLKGSLLLAYRCHCLPLMRERRSLRTWIRTGGTLWMLPLYAP